MGEAGDHLWVLWGLQGNLLRWGECLHKVSGQGRWVGDLQVLAPKTGKDSGWEEEEFSVGSLVQVGSGGSHRGNATSLRWVGVQGCPRVL